MRRMVPVIVLAIVLASSSAWAAEAALTLDMNSAYVWRGITFNDGWVAQPSIDVGKNGFGLNIWGNFDLSNYHSTVDDYNFSEIDLSPYYTFNIDRLALTFGVIDYQFPSSGADSTVELFGRAGIPIIGGLSANAAFYWDVDSVNSYYAAVGLAYTLAVTDHISLDAGATAGFAGKKFATYYSSAATDGGFYDYGLSLGLRYAYNDNLSVGAAIRYVGSLDKDVLPDANLSNGVYGVDTHFYGGATVTYKF